MGKDSFFPKNGLISESLNVYLSNKMPEYHYDIIKKAIKYLDENRTLQPSLEDVAEHVGMSYHHFQKTFKAWAGVSPKTFLQYLTVQHAKQLLKTGSTTLQAASEEGLSGNGRLHDAFLKITAMSPGEFKNKALGLTIHYQWQVSPFGNMLVASTAKGICFSRFVESEAAGLSLLREEFPLAEVLKDDHQSSIFDSNDKIDLHVIGSSFQLKVWEALLQIPQGAVVSYKDVAQFIGQPSASRAVGTAIGQNPVAYLIPCHRVIKSTGVFGEYRWAKERKQAIIGWEYANAQLEN